MERSSQRVKAIIEFLRDMKNLIGWKVTCFCFARENTLFSSAKQVIFLSKTSYFPFQNKLFSQTKQVKSRRETSCFGFRLVDTIVRDNRENAKRHQDCHAYREPSCQPRRKYASQQPYPPSSGTYPGYVLTHFLADPILPRSL